MGRCIGSVTLPQVLGQEITLESATLVLAVVGSITGLASLAWSIHFHRLTGARLKVDAAFGNVRTWRHPKWGSITSATNGDTLVVEVRNQGRLAANVVGFDLAYDGPRAGALSIDSTLLGLPHRLDVGQAMTWEVMTVGELERMVSGDSGNVGITYVRSSRPWRKPRVRIEVVTGSGTRSKSSFLRWNGSN